MLKAVYDTNILISALIGHGPPYKILNAVFKGKVIIVALRNYCLNLKML